MAFELLCQLCSFKCKPFKLCPTALQSLPKGFVIKRQTDPPPSGRGRLAFSHRPRNHHHLLESRWAWPGTDTYHRWHCAHDEDSSYGQGALGIGDDPGAQRSISTELWFLSSPTVQPQIPAEAPSHLPPNPRFTGHACVQTGKMISYPIFIKHKGTTRFYVFGFPYFFFIPAPHCQTQRVILRETQNHICPHHFYWAWKLNLLVCL